MYIYKLYIYNKKYIPTILGIYFLAVISSSRNTPWLLLFLRIMMMLPLLINSYNLISFHEILVKIILN